jgi:hypothetical protein
VQLLVQELQASKRELLVGQDPHKQCIVGLLVPGLVTSLMKQHIVVMTA